MPKTPFTHAWMAAGTLLFCTFSPASAQEIDTRIEAIRKCTLIENEVARLACFDTAASWLVINRGRPMVRNNRDTANVTATPLAPTNSDDLEAERRRLQREVQSLRNEKQSLVHTNNRDRDFSRNNSRDDADNMEAVVTKIAKLNYDRLRVFLNNGQVWDLTERGYLSALKKGATIIIEKAMLGSHTIKVKGAKGALKVKRVR